MKIRKIQLGDENNYLDMLLTLDNETKFMLFEPGERPTDVNIAKNIIERTANSDHLILVAVDDGQIIGFLSATKGFQRRIQHSAYIVTGILQDFRGNGIGTKLFCELDLWAIENNITRLELTVLCGNEIAIHLYKKSGFVVEGIKKNSVFVDGTYEDEFYMAKLYDNK